MLNNKIRTKIILLAEELLDRKDAYKEIDDNKDIRLKEIGIDSLRLFKFITKIEEEFKITFKDKDLEGSNFETLYSTEQLISTYLRSWNE